MWRTQLVIGTPLYPMNVAAWILDSTIILAYPAAFDIHMWVSSEGMNDIIYIITCVYSQWYVPLLVNWGIDPRDVMYWYFCILRKHQRKGPGCLVNDLCRAGATRGDQETFFGGRCRWNLREAGIGWLWWSVWGGSLESMSLLWLYRIYIGIGW